MAFIAFPPRYRIAAAAIACSAALHAAIFVGLPERFAAPDEQAPTVFIARIAALPPQKPKVSKVPARPEPRHAARRPVRVAKAAVHAPVEVAPPAEAPIADLASAAPLPERAPAAPEAAAPTDFIAPDGVVMAAPGTPLSDLVSFAAPPPGDAMVTAPQPAPDSSRFPVEGLPDRLSIDYRLTSALVDAHAAYHWSREGDAYRITGEGEAVGFFSLFLEGRIQQESRGTVTAAGLRPDRFVESKPGTAQEGLDFDWPDHKVTFEYGENRKTSPLTDDTVDWLSMIFQLAHVPPPSEAESMQIKVFTQRRLYDFHLKVLGEEEIDIPMGRVRALHLRHVDAADGQVVDVWLGIDQHYLPVKMRYPVARNRLMVEQAATSVSER
jgi:hypothetical protein